jgi:Glycosyl transferases group 1
MGSAKSRVNGSRQILLYFSRACFLLAILGAACQFFLVHDAARVPLDDDNAATLPDSMENKTLPHHANSTATATLQIRRAYVPLLDRVVDLPLRVVYWPYVVHGSKPDAFPVGEDGLKQSPFIQLVSMEDTHPDVVWVADEAIGGHRPADWCRDLLSAVEMVREKRQLKMPTDKEIWNPPIHFLQTCFDMPTDYACIDLRERFGRNKTRYFKRSVVWLRSWNSLENWVDTGRSSVKSKQLSDQIHTPLTVRTDVVAAIAKYLAKRNMTLSDDIEGMARPLDVAYFWPLIRPGDSTASEAVLFNYANLRNRVSTILDDLRRENPSWKVVIGLQGPARAKGRKSVAETYVDATLKTKIHVVAQRDDWEDHYRLMEALVSGALVLTDRMLSLPRGLENGTSVVEYSSADELRLCIEYYLEHETERVKIARRGRQVAMSQHRSWHRMEEVLFGRILSTCPLNNLRYPFIVHSADCWQL